MSAFASVLLSALVHNALETAALALVVVALCTVTRVSAGKCFLLYVSTIVFAAVMLVTDLLPVRTTAPTPMEMTGVERTAIVQQPRGSAARAQASEYDERSSATPDRGVPRHAIRLNADVMSKLAYIWLTIASLLLMRLLVQLVQLRLLRNALEPAPERVRRIAEEYRVRVAVSRSASLPFAIGIGTRLVVLPLNLAGDLSDESVRHVLMHEVAHIKRRDAWWQLAIALLRALLWANPIVLWLARRIELERELACDAWVLRRGGVPTAYARTILSVATQAHRSRRTSALAPSMGRLRSHLEPRVKSVLQPRPRAGGATALAIVFLGLATTAAALARAPRLFSFGALTSNPVLAADAIAGLDTRLEEFEAQGFAGSVLVAQNDSVVLARGYGFANRERGLRHDARTLYSVAGISKVFAATAILELQSEGKLKLSDPISKYLDVDGVKGSATIEQLMTHRAGLTVLGADVQRATRAAFIRAINDAPIDFAPGTAERYTDIGFSVLAAIVEVVTGESYESYVRRTIFERAGMRDARFENEVSLRETRLAREYTKSGVAPARDYVWGRRGALGVVTTLDDLQRFNTALEHGLLEPSARAALENGLGFDPSPMRNGSIILRRLGGTPSFQAEYLRIPRENALVLFAINNRVGWHGRVWGAISSALASPTEKEQ